MIETLAAKELEIITTTNKWYHLRIMPYRTLDNFIKNLVITLGKSEITKNTAYE